MLAAQIGHRNPGPVLLQDPDDLLFRKTTAPHALVLAWRELTSNWIKPVGQGRLGDLFEGWAQDTRLDPRATIELLSWPERMRILAQTVGGDYDPPPWPEGVKVPLPKFIVNRMRAADQTPELSGLHPALRRGSLPDLQEISGGCASLEVRVTQDTGPQGERRIYGASVPLPSSGLTPPRRRTGVVGQHADIALPSQGTYGWHARPKSSPQSPHRIAGGPRN